MTHFSITHQSKKSRGKLENKLNKKGNTVYQTLCDTAKAVEINM